VSRCLSAAGNGVPLIVAHAGVYHALRDVMAVPVGRVLHCVPYYHQLNGRAWLVETVV
jgi:hypothetical protein